MSYLATKALKQSKLLGFQRSGGGVQEVTSAGTSPDSLLWFLPDLNHLAELRCHIVRFSSICTGHDRSTQLMHSCSVECNVTKAFLFLMSLHITHYSAAVSDF